MSKIYFIIVLWLSKLIVFFNRLFNRTSTMISGKIAVILQKKFVSYFYNIDYDKTIFITGTNGKSTTTNLVSYTIKAAGYKVATNNEGANMISGIATTLIKNSNMFGRFNKEFLVLEIDERSLETIIKYLPAKNLCITNLQKDQVQRNGDPDFIYQKFKNSITKDMTLFINNEEPRSKSLEDFANRVYFGIKKMKNHF